MKPLYSILAAAMLLGIAIPQAQSAVRVSVDFFHDNLEPYGDWREVGDYGWCWQPRNVGRNWRPYSDGRWLYTDAGWTWDSDEPYSWAVYHYGRWARVNRIGWVWVPGTEWGPAWVSWRRSPRHVGWAPLPPEAEFNRSVGFGARVDADYDIGPTYYSFVTVGNFGAPRLRTVIIEPRENITIIRQTTNITRITYVDNVVYNEGPQYNVIARESALPIRRLKLERRGELDGDPGKVRPEQLRPRVEGDSLRVLALPIDPKPATAPRKVAAKVEKAEVDRGWKNAGPPAEVAKLRAKIENEPELPPQPNSEKTAEAPAVSPVQSREPDNQPPKGKLRKGGVTTIPAIPATTEVAPPSPEKSVAPEKPARPEKPAKGAKPVKPDASSVRPSPPAVEEAVPSSQFKKGRSIDVEAPRPPVIAPPQERIHGKKPKGENAEPTRNLPPAAEEARPKKKQPGKGDAQPNALQPPARTFEHKKPSPPEPQPQPKKAGPRQQAEPPATQPEPAKGRGKDKGKDKKKDEGKPEGESQ